ncbi:F-box protein ASCRUDRAFT_11735 [Ascoidea rubescens DSM 1968]|uniref:F-box domain-containing protein n=1 Tax=Ascoidea rubescens DSM 1968 TaxID=1344418 RepID=A0A1D2VS66_9ASCO|nr:hypothetical protein ASCRUDRAFT_11735 [Ascoidea rubescens DSM 1968]ODV64428.1 hypothetical protein ASCRUDRAFT_11735 [Ascoidea rubescens DSM 1968]
MMQITRLPKEIIEHIFENLSTKDLVSCSIANKLFSLYSLSRLYRNILVVTNSAYIIDQNGTDASEWTFLRYRNLVKFIAVVLDPNSITHRILPLKDAISNIKIMYDNNQFNILINGSLNISEKNYSNVSGYYNSVINDPNYGSIVSDSDSDDNNDGSDDNNDEIDNTLYGDNNNDEFFNDAIQNEEITLSDNNLKESSNFFSYHDLNDLLYSFSLNNSSVSQPDSMISHNKNYDINFLNLLSNLNNLHSINIVQPTHVSHHYSVYNHNYNILSFYNNISKSINLNSKTILNYWRFNFSLFSNFNSIISFQNLKKLDLLLDDIISINTNTRINFDNFDDNNNYNKYDSMIININTLKLFSHIETLNIRSTNINSFFDFLKKLYLFENDTGLPIFANLSSLSFSLIIQKLYFNCSDPNGMNENPNGNDFLKYFNKAFNINQLVQLEMNLGCNCPNNQYCNKCITTFLNDLFPKKCEKLKKLSITRIFLSRSIVQDNNDFNINNNNNELNNNVNVNPDTNQTENNSNDNDSDNNNHNNNYFEFLNNINKILGYFQNLSYLYLDLFNNEFIKKFKNDFINKLTDYLNKLKFNNGDDDELPWDYEYKQVLMKIYNIKTFKFNKEGKSETNYEEYVNDFFIKGYNKLSYTFFSKLRKNCSQLKTLIIPNLFNNFLINMINYNNFNEFYENKGYDPLLKFLDNCNCEKCKYIKKKLKILTIYYNEFGGGYTNYKNYKNYKELINYLINDIIDNYSLISFKNIDEINEEINNENYFNRENEISFKLSSNNSNLNFIKDNCLNLYNYKFNYRSENIKEHIYSYQFLNQDNLIRNEIKKINGGNSFNEFNENIIKERNKNEDFLIIKGNEFKCFIELINHCFEPILRFIFNFSSLKQIYFNGFLFELRNNEIVSNYSKFF